MCVIPRKTVNTFDTQSEHVDGLDTLINDHGNSSAVSLIQGFKSHTKDRIQRGEVSMVAISRNWRKPILFLWWPGLRGHMGLRGHIGLWRWHSSGNCLAKLQLMTK